MSAETLFHRFREVFDPLVILEIDGFVRTHFFGEIEAFLFSVHRGDILHTHGAQHRDADQPDRAAALHDDAAVETQDTRRLGALHRMDENGARLDEDSRIQIQVAHVEDRAAAADQNVIGKPAIEMNIVVGEKSVHVRAAHVLLI